MGRGIPSTVPSIPPTPALTLECLPDAAANDDATSTAAWWSIPSNDTPRGSPISVASRPLYLG